MSHTMRFFTFRPVFFTGSVGVNNPSLGASSVMRGNLQPFYVHLHNCFWYLAMILWFKTKTPWLTKPGAVHFFRRGETRRRAPGAMTRKE